MWEDQRSHPPPQVQVVFKMCVLELCKYIPLAWGGTVSDINTLNRNGTDGSARGKHKACRGNLSHPCDDDWTARHHLLWITHHAAASHPVHTKISSAGRRVGRHQGRSPTFNPIESNHLIWQTVGLRDCVSVWAAVIVIRECSLQTKPLGVARCSLHRRPFTLQAFSIMTAKKTTGVK